MPCAILSCVLDARYLADLDRALLVEKSVECSFTFIVTSNIPFVIEKIAQIKGISAADVERITAENAYRLFTRASHVEA